MAIKERGSDAQESIHGVYLALAPCLKSRHKLRTPESEIQGNQQSNYTALVSVPLEEAQITKYLR
jgi:hypothetical protein